MNMFYNSTYLGSIVHGSGGDGGALGVERQAHNLRVVACNDEAPKTQPVSG